MIRAIHVVSKLVPLDAVHPVTVARKPVWVPVIPATMVFVVFRLVVLDALSIVIVVVVS